jgi:hypothetical protein
LLIDVRAVLLSERLRQTPAPRRILNQGTGRAEVRPMSARCLWLQKPGVACERKKKRKSGEATGEASRQTGKIVSAAGLPSSIAGQSRTAERGRRGSDAVCNTVFACNAVHRTPLAVCL